MTTFKQTEGKCDRCNNKKHIQRFFLPTNGWKQFYLCYKCVEECVTTTAHMVNKPELPELPGIDDIELPPFK